MYLTREQISEFVNRIGQPRASGLLKDFFNKYRHYLSSQDVANLYDDNYRRHLDAHPVYKMVNGQYKVHIYGRYAYEYLLPRINSKSQILDYGCGQGDLALALATHGAGKVVGVDFSESVLSVAKSRVMQKELSVEFLQETMFSSGNNLIFDYIILSDVTEHLSDQELIVLFGKFKTCLHPQSEILIHTPNGLALCNLTDKNLFQSIYINYLKFCGWMGHEKSVDQLYYEQVHINVKSYRQISKFFNNLGYATRVIYDEKNRWPFMTQLSSNMFIVAKLKV